MSIYYDVSVRTHKWFLFTTCLSLILIIVYYIKGPKSLLIYKTYYKVVEPEDGLYCHFINTFETLSTLNEADVEKDTSIFFIESSCSSYVNGKITINARQACAIESTALMNPNRTIYLLYSSPGNFRDDKTESDRLIKNLRNYRNVKVLHVNMEEFVSGTPVENIWRTGQIQKSKYVIAHTSDILRLLVLWKFGGIYLDLDVVVIKPLETLPKNFAGAESMDSLANGVLGFTSSGIGHRHVNSCLNDISNNFDGINWSVNGPQAIQRMLYPLCKTHVVSDMINKTCEGFAILPPNFFYSIPYTTWRVYFDEEKIEYVRDKTKDSYLIHVWNKLSYESKIPVYSNVPYFDFAREYCPGTVDTLDVFF